MRSALLALSVAVLLAPSAAASASPTPAAPTSYLCEGGGSVTVGAQAVNIPVACIPWIVQ